LPSFARRTRIPHFLFTAAGPRPLDFIPACKPDVLVVRWAGICKRKLLDGT
jgi:hypothetical protein